MRAETIEHHECPATVIAAGNYDFPLGNPTDSRPAYSKAESLVDRLPRLADPVSIHAGAMPLNMSPVPVVVAIAAVLMAIFRILTMRIPIEMTVFCPGARWRKGCRCGNDKSCGYHSRKWVLHHLCLLFSFVGLRPFGFALSTKTRRPHHG
jgi:hypothetical protein